MCCVCVTIAVSSKPVEELRTMDLTLLARAREASLRKEHYDTSFRMTRDSQDRLKVGRLSRQRAQPVQSSEAERNITCLGCDG